MSARAAAQPREGVLLRGDNGGYACLQAWPEYDASKTVADTVQMAVQVSGKVKAIRVYSDILTQEEIAQNAGVDGSVVFEKIKNSKKVGFGYNAYTEEYCDMIASGIVDPTKVTRSSLENAASIAACVLTTESLVADKKDPAADMAAMNAAAAAGAGMY